MKKLFVLLAMGIAMGTAAAEKVQLAKNGRALAKIVVATNATKAARFAAADLKWHLDHITGADIEIVSETQFTNPEPRTPKHVFPIFVGFSHFTKAKPADFKPQQFLVDIRKDAIELVGPDKDDHESFALILNDQGALVGESGRFPDLYDA